MPDPQINVVACLLRVSASQYACVVRWLLGDAEDLPNVDDVFDVSLTIQTGNTSTQVATAVVKPRLYAMIDPSRVAQTIQNPSGGTTDWMAALKPTAPVNPSDADTGTLVG